jgi:hypothetical protein
VYFSRKKKRQELIDRKAKLKAQIELEENEITTISSDILNIQVTKDSNEIDLKCIENTIQEEYLDEAKQLQNNFELANKRLNSLINSNEEMTSKLESLKVCLTMYYSRHVIFKQVKKVLKKF